jgi:hypothetical protein
MDGVLDTLISKLYNKFEGGESIKIPYLLNIRFSINCIL